MPHLPKKYGLRVKNMIYWYNYKRREASPPGHFRKGVNQMPINSCKCIDQWKELQPILERRRHEAGALIPVLQEAQKLYGHLSIDLMAYIAAQMNLAPAKVLGVATFYTQFRLQPVGKHLILLCQGTACHVNGSAAIEAALLDELGVDENEITADGLFTLTNVACLGCCSLSPVMMIGETAHGSLTPDTARQIIRGIRTKEAKA